MSETERSFEISRAKWLRGESDSKLLRPADDKRCCIGIYLGACGVPDKDLRGLAVVADVIVARALALPPRAAWLWNAQHDNESDTAADDGVYQFNDARGTSDERREVLIAEFFAAHGERVTFVD